VCGRVAGTHVKRVGTVGEHCRGEGRRAACEGGRIDAALEGRACVGGGEGEGRRRVVGGTGGAGVDRRLGGEGVDCKGAAGGRRGGGAGRGGGALGGRG